MVDIENILSWHACLSLFIFYVWYGMFINFVVTRTKQCTGSYNKHVEDVVVLHDD